MSDLNLFNGGGVTHGTYTGGAYKFAKGFGMHQPLPVFKGAADAGDLWDATNALPYGLNAGCTVRGAWAHGGYLYLVIYNSNAGISGIYRRSLVGTPPTHTTHGASVTATALFGGGSLYRAFYDPVEEAVYVARGTNGALTGVIGKWKMSTPFATWAPGTAEWISLDSSFGSRIAGKVAYLPRDMWLGGGKLFVSAGFSGSVFTLDASTGAVDGEWAYRTVYDDDYNFALLGYDSVNDYVVGGANTAAAGGGAIKTWDFTVPTAPTAIATVISASSYASHMHQLHGRTPNALRSVGTSWGTFLYSLSQTALAHVVSDEFLWWQFMRMWDGWAGVYRAKIDGTEFYRHGAADAGQLGGLTGSAPNTVYPALCDPGGVAYLMLCATGTPRQIDIAGTNDPEGSPYLQCVDHGSYIATYTATGPMTLKKLLVDMDPTATDREVSCHQGKHRFRCRKNGGAWGDYRAGYELLRLDQVVNAKAAWPSLVATDVLEIQHEMTSGFFDHFLPQVEAASGCEKASTTLKIGGLSDIGAPSEVWPVLCYEGDAVVHTLIGVEASVVVEDEINVSVEVSA